MQKKGKESVGQLGSKVGDFGKLNNLWPYENEVAKKQGKREHTIDGPLTFRSSPFPVFSIVSPPTISEQSLNMTTQTNGKQSSCHPNTSFSSFSASVPRGGGEEGGGVDVSPSGLTETLQRPVSYSKTGMRSTPAT